MAWVVRKCMNEDKGSVYSDTKVGLFTPWTHSRLYGWFHLKIFTL